MIPAEERELLTRYRPWLRRVAAGMTIPDQVEDLAQEGWVALWRALRSWNRRDPLDYWVKRKATERMLTLVQRDWQTRKALLDVPAGHPAHAEVDPVWDQLRVALPDIEGAYHHGEIHQAIAALTPREKEYVYLRFWGDYRKPDMIGHFGYEPSGVWRSARRKLADTLAHLAPVNA